MASNYTEHYQLPIWSPEDSFLREEFNESHQKIDAALEGLDGQLKILERTAGNCRYICGSYIGTGLYGHNRKNTLTFPSQPLVVMINGGWRTWFLRGSSSATADSGSNSGDFLNLEWEGHTVRWYNTSDETRQLNEKDTTYRYMAFLDATEPV